MNQIILPINNNENESKTHKKNLKYYKYLLFFSVFIIFISIIIYFFITYNSYKKQKVSKNLINNFNITTLYANSTNLSLERISNDNDNPFVIGVIEIDKINLIYPILSSTTEEFLKISPCKFYGPMPNEIGNLCIAGHNYANNTIFGKLHYLEIGDIIKIYDLSGNSVDYKIYKKQEVPATDTSCTNQNTNNKREITLVTCNTLNGNRLVFKCLESIQ